MTNFPFIRSPDIFALSVLVDTPGLSRRFFQSEWGQTDEELCFFNGILLGLIERTANVDDLQISLVPRLNAERAFPWPSEEEFAGALLGSQKAARDWRLWCEVDADQSPVDLVSGQMIEKKLEAAIAFCAGRSKDCPTFSTSDLFSAS